MGVERERPRYQPQGSEIPPHGTGSPLAPSGKDPRDHRANAEGTENDRYLEPSQKGQRHEYRRGDGGGAGDAQQCQLSPPVPLT